MGKPVVATATRTMDLFADHVYLPSTPDEWLLLLEEALAEHGPERRAARIAFAQSHSWEASAGQLYAAVDRAKEQPAPALSAH
jgi:hypothetical protein